MKNNWPDSFNMENSESNRPKNHLDIQQFHSQLMPQLVYCISFVFSDSIIQHQYSHMKLSITLFDCHYQSGIEKPLSI